MKNITLVLFGMVLAFSMGFYYRPGQHPSGKTKGSEKEKVSLGAFSMSLSVKDLKISRDFYEDLGFKAFGGSEEHNYLIMKNGNALIGLFQGMFEGNILTFNPGWDENAKNMKKFNDIRELQKIFKSNGLVISPEIDEKSTGPASFTIQDPDGNMILFDQHR